MTRLALAMAPCATQGCKGRSATKSENRLVLSTALALSLCAAPVWADAPTHQVVVQTPGGPVASEPMPRDECMEKAARIDGHVFAVPVPVGIALVPVTASCQPVGVAS